ncbi:hypothetical protein BSKO_13689 [Bryopsis sp. KO-2023]|nr:hypothetical protein BSKO_13689 [Bryopsis sp. KO-2023]
MEMSDVQCSLILSNEIATVATALRQNAKWAFVGVRYDDEDQLDDPLLEEFLALRQKVLYWGEWELVDPLEYLAPFLDAVKSQEVSGPITGTALASLWKLLTSNVISPSTINAAEAVRRIVSAVQDCRFETTGHFEDEAVLMRIVQVLVACVRSDVGLLLSASDVQEIFFAMLQWCEVGSGTSGSEPSRVFAQSARHMLGELISGLFARLRMCRVPDLGVFGGRPGNRNPLSRSRSGQSLSHGGASMSPTLSFSLSEPGRASPHPMLVCGIDPLREMFLYFVALATSESKSASVDDNVLFALRMIHTAVVSAGEAIAEHRSLLSLIRTQLFVALNQALTRPPQSIHAAVFQVVLAMYKLFGDKLILQIECFFQTSLLRLCEGKGCYTQEHQEVALEALLDFCGHPDFLRDMYLNLDCRIERTNLFEDICALLSKMAFPVKAPLGAPHMISLEGLLAMLFTLSAGCSSDGLTVKTPPDPKAEMTEYADIWGDILLGQAPKLEGLLDDSTDQSGASDYEDNSDPIVRTVRLEKMIKQRVSVAADHFNRDFKKGFQFMQALHLLPKDNDARCIANFLRVCPLLDKEMAGDLLGERDDFYKQILQTFTESFNFADLSIDMALRMFLDTFKLPGEAQQVDRVLENFSKVYFKQQVNGVVKEQDGVHVLAFSIVMLNTDLHNSNVKTQMTMEDFVRNLRGLNGGVDFPLEMLQNIYRSIAKSPMRLQDLALEVPVVRWLVLDQQGETERGKMIRLLEISALDRDMFSLIWGPTVAAVSVVLDQADDLTTVQTALTGLKLAAKIASYYGVDEVIDNLVVTLCKFTSQLTPGVAKPLVHFGMNRKAQVATEAVFFIANRYGDTIRIAGWRSIMECVIRLYRLGVLPQNFWEEIDGSDPTATEPALELVNEPESTQGSGGGGSVGGMFNWFSGSSRDSAPTPEEREAQKRTVKCIENCNIRDLFRDTKFLQLEALLELVGAITWASGSTEGSSPTSQPVATDERSASLALDLLLFITLRNRDRIHQLWPCVHTYLEGIMSHEEGGPFASGFLIEGAILGLLKVCQRLLPYKPEVADLLLKSLELVLGLDPGVVRDMAERVAMEVLGLVKGAAAFVDQGWAWSTICLLLRMTATSPEAFNLAFEAFVIIVKDGAHLSSSNFTDCLATARSFVDRSSRERPEIAVQVFNLMEDMVRWLPNWRAEEGGTDGGGAGAGVNGDVVLPAGETKSGAEGWSEVVKALCSYSLDSNEQVRNHAVVALHRAIMLGESLQMDVHQWGAVVKHELLELVQVLVKKVAARELPQSDKTLRTAVKTLSKTFLLLLGQLRTLPTFPAMWLEILTVFQLCCVNRNDDLSEAVPEEVKNMLLVLAKEGILTKEWVDDRGNSLWDATWRKSRGISFGLDPEILKTWLGDAPVMVAQVPPPQQA